jgi:hypothetical protein
MGQCSRRKRQQRHNLKNEHSPQAAPRTAARPTGDPVIDFLSNINLTDLLTNPSGPTPEPKPEPEPAGQDTAQESGYSASRWNSYRDGRRAKVLFPPPIQTLIDELTRDFAALHRARTKLDYWLCKESARSSVQIDVCGELLIADKARVLERVESSFDADCGERADRLAKKLPLEPYDVARELGRSKYGTFLLISRWEALGEAVASNHRLDEAQIQIAYDLLAVPLALRNGSRQVPPADDEPAILALVGREVARHRANLQRSLNESHELERKAAGLGMMKERDKITRGLRADETRALRRFRWAQETIEKLRQGVDPSTIIDPDTKAPIKPDTSTAPVSEPEPEPAAAESPPPPPSPPPATPTSPEVQTESPQRPLPKVGSEDDAEMLLIAAEVVGELFGPSGVAQPQADEPRPVPPG